MGTIVYMNTNQTIVKKRPIEIKESEEDEIGDWFYPTCGDFDSSTSSWCLDETEKWRYMNTSKRRRTWRGIHKCLANKRVMMVGDSRTRMQFLSLASAALRKAFPSCPNLLVDETYHCLGFKSWSEFYNQTHEYFSTPNSTEACYCHRKLEWYSIARENRFIRIATKYGNVSLDYLQNFVNYLYLGSSFEPFNEGSPACEPGNCYFPNPVGNQKEYFGPTMQVLMDHIGKFNPPVTHLFVHAGWGSEDLGCDIVKLRAKTSIKAWAMTAPFQWQQQHELADPSTWVQSCNVSIYDRTTMTKDPIALQLYLVDRLHLGPNGEEEVNHALLDLVCPTQGLKKRDPQ